MNQQNGYKRGTVRVERPHGDLWYVIDARAEPHVVMARVRSKSVAMGFARCVRRALRSNGQW